MRYVGIDISTNTGVVIMDEQGKVQYEEELNGKCNTAHEMRMYIEEIMNCVSVDDRVILEGFGFASKKGFLLGGIGWGVRMKLDEMGIKYIEVPPTVLKKFATGKGNSGKQVVMREVFKRWGYENDSDNIVDGYVLAQIGRAADGKLETVKFQKEALNKVSE